MHGINWPRVVLGGLVAGLVINVGEYVLNGIVLADAWSAQRTELGLGPISAVQALGAVLLVFLYGFVVVWLYAAIQPRFGRARRQRSSPALSCG